MEKPACIFFILFLIIGSLSYAADEKSPTDGITGERNSQKGLSCSLLPLLIPPTPEKLPGYTELDVTTGLHVTGTIQNIDINSYRLTVSGKVAHPLSLTYEELRCMRRIEASPSLVCPGFFVDTVKWAGVPIRDVLNMAGLRSDAKEIRLKGADNYYSTTILKVAMDEKNFLAYEWEGKALPRLHGFPVRAIFSEQEGNQWVKWLIAIEVN